VAIAYERQLRTMMLTRLARLSTPGLLTLVTLGQWAADRFVRPSLEETGTIPGATLGELLAAPDADADEDESVPPLALTPWDLDELATATELCAVLLEGGA